MKLQLIPYESLGPIRFGMRREEVKMVVSVPVKAYRKTPKSSTLTDAFVGEGIHVYYDEQDACIAIEVASPSMPLWRDRSLIGDPFSSSLDWLKSLDPNIVVEDSGLTS